MHIKYKTVKAEEVPELLSGHVEIDKIETEFVDDKLKSMTFYRKDGSVVGKFDHSGYEMKFLIPI